MTDIDVEEEVRGFEAEVGAVRARVRACVERLLAMPDHSVAHLFAERLGALGSVIVDDLYALGLDNPSSTADQRYLAAWVAVQVGDRGAAVDHLCEVVASGSPRALYAANALARLGLVQGRDAVTAAIATVDPGYVLRVFEWGTALRALGGHLPLGVRRELEARTDRWPARATLADFPLANLPVADLPVANLPVANLPAADLPPDLPADGGPRAPGGPGLRGTDAAP